MTQYDFKPVTGTGQLKLFASLQRLRALKTEANPWSFLFIDFKKVLDPVDKGILYGKMNTFGIPNNLHT